MNLCLNCEKPVNNKYCNTSCQNQHRGKLNQLKPVVYKEKICPKCNTTFLDDKKTDRTFCSHQCANSREWNDEKKNKVSNTLKEKPKIGITKCCLLCKKEYYIRPSKFENSKFCTKECIKQFHIENGLYIKCLNCEEEIYVTKSKINKTKFCCKTCKNNFNKENNYPGSQKGGLASAKIQSETRRSKNEMYFSDLCKEHFNNISNNEAIFNGWDADVIIHDINVAVLWNGKWHYEKITKKHSVVQVQNRDRIKIKEIINYGYIPYVIKDMGKHNEKFVNEEFQKFLIWIKEAHFGIQPKFHL